MKQKNSKFQPKIRKHDYKKCVFIMAICGVVLMTTAFLLLICKEFFSATSFWDGGLGKTWFGILQFFTNQSNLLLLIYFLLFLFFFKTKIFDTDIVLIYFCSYIATVFIVFWTILAPTAVFNREINFDPFSFITQGIMHLVTPLYFFVFTHFALRYPGINPKLKIGKIHRYICIGMIYPMLYTIYLVTINFVEIPESVFNKNIGAYPVSGHSYISVYSIVSNFNPKCINYTRNPLDNTVIYDYSQKGNPLFLFMVPFVWLVFYCLQLSLFLWNNRIHTLNESKRKVIRKK